MNKRLYIASILTIVLCFVLIIGSTYALFTSEDSATATITSGKVKVEAGFSDVTTYSAVADAQGTLVDENNAKYKYTATAVNGTFTNGGTATIDGNTLKLNLLTPGDKVSFKVNTTNTSDVAAKYRVKMTLVLAETPTTATPAEAAAIATANANACTLWDGLNFTANGTAFNVASSVGVKTTSWSALAVGSNGTDTFTVELPVSAGNDYQSKTVTVYFTVEAVQGNAVVE